MQTKEKELKKEEQKEEYRRETGRGIRPSPSGLFGCLMFYLFLVGRLIISPWQHLSIIWQAAGWRSVDGCVDRWGVVIVMEMECHSKNRKDPGAEHCRENHQHVILCVLYIFCWHYFPPCYLVACKINLHRQEQHWWLRVTQTREGEWWESEDGKMQETAGKMNQEKGWDGGW